MELTREKMLALYETMLKIRRFEERIAEMFAAGSIPGFVHLCVGQEAVAAGVAANLRIEDYIVSTHRGHGHCIAKGADLAKLAAEIFGRKTGYCQGRGGSMHISAMDVGIIGTNGIVGGGFPMATGAAFSALYRGTDQVTVCFFGEGATGQGTFHEAMNLSALWKLPVVFVCESNGWAEFSPFDVHVPVPTVSQRAQAYGIPGVTVDGNDVLAVYEAAGRAVDRARKGDGPTLLECVTHRWRGHYEGDPQRYRPEGDLAASRANDPITRFQAKLVELGHLSAEEDAEIKSRVEKAVEDAISFAQNSPFPAPEEILQGVYA